MPGLPIPFFSWPYSVNERGEFPGGQEQTHGFVLPLFPADFEVEIPGEVEITRPVTFALTGSLALSLGDRVEMTTPGSLLLSRDMEFVIHGTREPAHHYVNLLREDDEFIMAL